MSDQRAPSSVVAHWQLLSWVSSRIGFTSYSDSAVGSAFRFWIFTLRVYKSLLNQFRVSLAIEALWCLPIHRKVSANIRHKPKFQCEMGLRWTSKKLFVSIERSNLKLVGKKLSCDGGIQLLKEYQFLSFGKNCQRNWKVGTFKSRPWMSDLAV